MKKNLSLALIGLMGSLLANASFAIPLDANVSLVPTEIQTCSGCQMIPTDLLTRPLQEGLKYTQVKLRLKKEMYLVNERKFYNDVVVYIGGSGGISDCQIRAATKYIGKVVSCSNTDGSPREIVLSKSGVSVHGASPSTAEPYTLDIKTDLPISFDSTGNSFGIRTRSTISCSYTSSSTLGDLINALSDYYEVEGAPSTNAQTI